MFLQRGAEDRKRMRVQTEEQFLGRRRRENFVEEDLQRGVGKRIEAERRFAHFSHALAQGCGMLCAVMRVQREDHLQLVDGFGGEPREEDLVQAFEGVVKPFQSPHTFFHGKTGLPRGAK